MLLITYTRDLVDIKSSIIYSLNSTYGINPFHAPAHFRGLSKCHLSPVWLRLTWCAPSVVACFLHALIAQLYEAELVSFSSSSLFKKAIVALKGDSRLKKAIHSAPSSYLFWKKLIKWPQIIAGSWLRAH